MSEIMAEGIPCMLGLRRLVAELEQRNTPWAVATSSRKAYANQVLEQLDLREKCKAIAAGDDVERGKPAPDVYLLAADRLDIDPASCLALEDSVPGISRRTEWRNIADGFPRGRFRFRIVGGGYD